MRKLLKLGMFAGIAYAAKMAYDNFRAAQGPARSTSGSGTTGYDTPTGTDPGAKYDRPGYEDKSFGQAVAADQRLADEIAHDTGNFDEAEDRFRRESAGAPAIARQERDDR